MIKRYFKLISLIIIVTLFLGILFFISSRNNVIAYLNNEKIYEEEALLFLDSKKIEVFNELNIDGKYENNHEFWEMDFNGVTPLDIAREKALNEVIEIKVVQAIGIEKGFIEDGDFLNIKKEMKNENSKREKDVKNNEVIYGPKKFDIKQYYIYKLENLRNEIKRKIEGEEVDLSSEKIEEYYNEKKEEEYKLEDKIVIDVISINYINEELKVTDENKSNALKEAEEVREGLINNKDIETLIKPEFKTYTETFDYSNKTESEKNKVEILEEAKRINIGEVSNIIDYNGSYNILICKEKSQQGYVPLENIEDQIRVKIVEDYYNKLVESKLKASEVKVEREILKRIK